MRGLLRRWTCLGLIAVGLVSGAAAGCGSDSGESTGSDAAAPAKSTKPVRIAFFGPVVNGFTAVMADGVKEVAKEKQSTVRVFDPGFDVSREFTQIQDAIAVGKYDAFVIYPLDATTLVPIVTQAIAAGIKVVTVNSPLGSSLTSVEPQVKGQSATVMEDLKRTTAQSYVDLTAQACEGIDPCRFAYVAGAPATSLEKVLIDSMKAGLAKHKNIELVSILDGKGYQQQAAYTATQDLLQAHSDVHVIGSSGDQMALGVALAVKQAKASRRVKIWGAGGSCLGIKALKKGQFFGTTLRVPKTDGRLAADFVIRAARGEKVPTHRAGSDEAKQATVITKSSLRPDFECQWQGS